MQWNITGNKVPTIHSTKSVNLKNITRLHKEHTWYQVTYIRGPQPPGADQYRSQLVGTGPQQQEVSLNVNALKSSRNHPPTLVHE